MTNSINDTVAGGLMYLQDNYRESMTHEILEREDIVKKKTYHTQDLIVTVFPTIKELLNFSDVTGISYLQQQDVNIAYMIIHKTGKFVLEIREWNACLQYKRRGWVSRIFLTAHQKLWETTYLNVKDAQMHHANTVRNVVAGLHEVLHQEQALIDYPTTVLEPHEHAAIVVQSNKQQLYA